MMQAIILAGGSQAQLHPWAAHTPKPMLPFFDRPVTEHIIRLLARHDIRDIIITTSGRTMDVPEYFGDGSNLQVNLRYSIEDKPAGTAGAIRRVESLLTGTFIVISSDIITDLDISAAIDEHKSAGAIATVLTHQVGDPTGFGVLCWDETGKISKFVEKPRSTEVFSDTISTGIYVLEPEVISNIAPYSTQDFARHVFPLLLRNQESMHASHLPGYWCDLGDILQYRTAHFDALQGKVRIDLPAVYAGEGIWVGEGVDLHPSVQLAPSVLIGSTTSIARDAVIGKNTIIGSNSQIAAGANISHSIIGSGAAIMSEARIADTVIAGGANKVDPEQPIQPPQTIEQSTIGWLTSRKH